MTRTAIIFSGSAYNVKFSLPSLMENLVIPNNADVFVLTERRCLRRKTPAGDLPDISDWEKWEFKNRSTIADLNQPLTDEEIALIKTTFGDRLKGFYLIDEMQDFLYYMEDERRKMMVTVNAYINENNSRGIKPPFPFEMDHIDNGNLRCVINQFRQIKKCYEYMREYEDQNGFKYDYVMRARIDFIAPEKIIIEYYTPCHDWNYWYIMGSVLREPFPFSDEFCWFSRRSISDRIFLELDRMGLITDRKYDTYYAPQNNDFRFSSETQFGLYIKELNIPFLNIKIFRSSKYTNDGDYDYMNYAFRRDMLNVEQEYQLACNCPSDINQHLPKLREYAEKCKHITEFGTRYGNSAIAFMSAYPAKFISYDVTHNDRIDYLRMVSKDAWINCHFRLEDVEQIEIEETDLLFIDTNHHARQCANELKLHAGKARKYIVFHDTETFGHGLTGGQGGEPGLWYAINPFLESHPEWAIEYNSKDNNGLLILKRNEV
jgi:hypothetical protein